MTDANFQNVYDILKNKALEIPDNSAVVFKNKSITFKELIREIDDFSDTIANNMNSDNSIIGIVLNRSIEMIASIFAVLKAGAAFLPVDPNYPQKRIKYMLNDSKTNLVISHKSLNHLLDGSIKIINIDDDNTHNKSKGSNQNSHGMLDNSLEERLAYVIYTSGSSGVPKGVMISHKAVINFTDAIVKVIDLSPGKKIAGIATVSFDMFVFEILALTHGVTLVLADENERKNPRLLNKLILDNDIDILQLTPSQLQIMLNDNKSLDCFMKLSQIIVGGEAFPQNLLNNLKKHTKARIYNGYGPTEATICCTMADLTDKDEINIGKPLSNTRIHIINKDNKPAPVGQEGELYISGTSLAKGYLNRPELTNEKFVVSEQWGWQRVYKTGDLARWLPDGSIEYLRRMDNQVKVGGHRIELEEIENNLNNYGLIKRAAVITQENGRYICAYYIADSIIPSAHLDAYLKDFLPEYMIPSHYIRMIDFPLNENGKINKDMLLLPEETHYDVKPDDSVQQKLMEIIANNVSGVEFSNLSINSLDFVKVVIDIEKEYGFEFDYYALSWERFETFEALADYIKTKI